MRKSLMVAGGLALALALVGCGETTEGTPTAAFGDAKSLVSAASESTAKQKSSKMTMEMKMGPITATGNGVGLYDGANSKMAMTMSMDMSAAGMGPMEIEMRMLDGVVYMKMPSGMAGMPEGDQSKPWIKMDLSDMAGAGGMDISKMMEQNDPTKMLELLEESGKLTGTEQTQVDGRPATKYSFDVDFKKMMEQYGGGLGQMGDLDGLDMDSMPMHVWINAENLPVQFTIDMSDVMKKAVESAGSSAPAGMNFDNASMTMKYTDWGTEVTVEAPPKSEISEAELPG